MSKKILAALGSLVVAGAALTACSSDGDTGTTSSTSSSSATTSSSSYSQSGPVYSSDDRLDEAMIRVAGNEGIYLPEGMGTDYAYDTCELFDKGYSLEMVVITAYDQLDFMGLDFEDHAFLIGASIGGLCPEYEYLVG